MKVAMRQAVLPLVATFCVGCHTHARLPYAFTPEERDAVEALLRAQPGWHIATAHDNTDPALAQFQREQPGYEPYFRRGDWNGDGHSDFAVVLVHDATMAAYYFLAKDGGFAPGAELAQADWLRTGGLFEHEGALTLAPFNSDELFSFRWDSTRHALTLVPPDTTDSGP